MAANTVWVRVEGRGTFQNSAGLKEFADEMMRRGHREFVVDLVDCELMDSTFLGTLTGVALGLRPAGRLTVVRANPRNSDIMRNLGLDRIFDVEDKPPAPEPEKMSSAEPGGPQPAARRTIVEAHENLVAASPENAVRFKDVLEFLQHKEQ